MPLAVHEGIEYSDKSCSLTRKILKVKNLITGYEITSCRCFKFLLITLYRKHSTCVEEVVSLIEHALLFEIVTEYFKVTCFKYTFVFVYLSEIRIYGILADFMCHNRNMWDKRAVGTCSFDFFYSGSVLYLYLFAIACSVCVVGVTWNNIFIIIMHCGWFVPLNMSERSITHTVRAAYKSVLAETYAYKKVIFREQHRSMLEIV